MEEILSRLASTRILVMDVDGVLTDGRIIYGDHGDELKFFDVQDGLGLSLLRKAGILTAIVTAKKSRINERRAKELKVTKIFQKVSDKGKVCEKLYRQFKLEPAVACYIGDDLLDLPAMRISGTAVAVSNAVDAVKSAAHYVTTRSGGRGAVREVCDLILKAQGRVPEIV